MPTFPFELGNAAAHSTVSNPSSVSCLKGYHSPSELKRPRTSCTMTIIAARGAHAGKLDAAVLVVGRARKQHRECSLSGRAIDIGAQLHAISGGHHNAALDDDFRSDLAQGDDRGQRGNSKNKQAKSLFRHGVPSGAKVESIL